MNMSVVKREGRRMNTEIMNISGFSYKDIYHCNIYFDCSGEKNKNIIRKDRKGCLLLVSTMLCCSNDRNIPVCRIISLNLRK